LIKKNIVIACLFITTTLISIAGHVGIQRDPAQRAAFVRQYPCPVTHLTHGACTGWVVDHIKPLACGGADRPENMQWQTAADGKAKDRIERIGC